jgi:ParB family transcriptional regulator, chromosome partitioning protein
MSSELFRDSIFWVEVERIKPNPYQPRREFDQGKLQELSESIRMYGLLQPLTVTRNEIPREDGGLVVEYELIAGERRLRASKLAGLSQVPVIIRVGEETDQMKLELAIIENLQREDLNPIDRAKAFEKLYKEFKFTHQEIGRKVGKSREYVSNTLRLLLLPEHLLTHLAEGKITEGHTRPLLMLNDRPEEQTVLAREILLKKLTVRESESLARRVAQDKVSAKHKINPDILALERALTEQLGTRVTIEPREVGGRVVISFFSADDLHALLDSMRVQSESVGVSEVFNGIPVTPVIPNPDIEIAQAQAHAEAAVAEIPLDQVPIEVLLGEDVPPVDDSTLHDAAEFDALMTQLEEQGGVVDEVSADVPEVVSSVVPVVQPEDDQDLYSIRNFTV